MPLDSRSSFKVLTFSPPSVNVLLTTHQKAFIMKVSTNKISAIFVHHPICIDGLGLLLPQWKLMNVL